MDSKSAPRDDEILARFMRGNGNTHVKQADDLVNLALELFELKVAHTGEAFALRRAGPRIALMFKGSRDALRSTLATEYRRKHGKTPNATALADAMTVLQGEALGTQPTEVHLRVAEHDNGIVLDLGRQDGHVVVLRPSTWEVLDQSPVIFRRTALTGELPLPQANGDINQLRHLLNVTDESWLMMLAWLVAAYFPAIPHPILMAGGEQGSGKTSAVSILGSLIDPSPAPVRSQPHDPESWAIAAAGSWLVAVDNVSTIPAWWSDCLCKAVTGDGWIRRKLYTDGELSVLSFRRVVALTSIDAGALRGDLGDRILLADLEPIPAADRRSEAELMQVFGAVRAGIFGGLLDLLASVLVRLPQVRLTELPRMADFAKVVAALDSIRGTKALDLYLGQRERVVREVLDGDPVAGAVQALPDGWTGTAGELLKAITPEGKRAHGWPMNPRALTARIKRLLPAFRQVGLTVHVPTARTNRGRTYRIERVAEKPSQPSQQSPAERKPSDGLVVVVTVDDCQGGQPSPTCHRENDGGDGGDGISLPPSDANANWEAL